jgi:hypothetical protein
MDGENSGRDMRSNPGGAHHDGGRMVAGIGGDKCELPAPWLTSTMSFISEMTARGRTQAWKPTLTKMMPAEKGIIAKVMENKGWQKLVRTPPT